MFEKFGTPAFLREARASGGRRFAPVVMVLIFFAVYVVSGYAEGFLMTPFLVAVFLSDGALYGMLSDGTDAAEIYTYIEQMTRHPPTAYAAAQTRTNSVSLMQYLTNTSAQEYAKTRRQRHVSTISTSSTHSSSSHFRDTSLTKTYFKIQKRRFEMNRLFIMIRGH